VTEDQLKAAVIDLAHLLGWRVAHFRPAQTVHGWRTPVEADGKGFPDLVLVRGPWVLFAELKGDKGKLSDEQGEWLTALNAATPHVYVWTPSHWHDGRIEETLRLPALMIGYSDA
jgi:hypothetical protein